MDEKEIFNLTMHHSYFLYNEGTFYYINMDNELALIYQNDKWLECDYKKASQFHTAKMSLLVEMVKVSPKEAMKALIKQKEDRTKEYWENLINNAQNNIIGYIDSSYGTENFVGIEAGDLSDEEYASIIKDYREKGYFYSGEDYQNSDYANTPILDNYRYVSFSRRGFGGLIALVKGDYSLMGYALYTENAFIEEEKKFPKEGIYKTIKRGPLNIEVDENIFSSLGKETMYPGEGFVVIYVDNDKGYYWYNDVLTLSYKDKNMKTSIYLLATFFDEEEFTTYLERYGIEIRNGFVFIPNKTMLFLTPYNED